MMDQYQNFAELQCRELEGTDYRICVTERKSFAVIIAPHGGWIEPGTSEIAAAIAGNIHGLYCFEGLRNRPHRELHITSTNFDESRCLSLIKQCKTVVAVHGMCDNINAVDVDVGGQDETLRAEICKILEAIGFKSKVVTSGHHAAISEKNICNRGKRKKGVQLEIARGLRDALMSGEADLSAFAKSVQQTVSSQQPS